MQKSKAISPEMSGIFERIEKQAEEYEHAFDELNKFYRDSVRMRRENEELILKNQALFEKNTKLIERIQQVDAHIESYISLRLDKVFDNIIHHLEINIIDDFKARMNNEITEFSDKVGQAIGMVEGTNGLIELLKKLQEASADVEQKVSDVENKLIDANKVNAEIFVIKEEFIETKYHIEVLITDFNKKMSSIVKDMQTELKALVTKSTYDIEDRIKNTVIQLKEMQIRNNQRIDYTERKLELFMGVATKLELHLKKIKESGIDMNRSSIEELKARIEEMELNIKHIKEAKHFKTIEFVDGFEREITQQP